MPSWLLVLITIMLAGLTMGCSALAGTDVAQARVISLPIESAKPARVSVADATSLEQGAKKSIDDCPVTIPAEQSFSPSAPYPARFPYAGRTWYGTEALWTALPDDGRWSQLLRGDKVFWWSAGFSVSEEPQPELWMTARQLDGYASVEDEPPATNAYHEDFQWAMLTGFSVPSPGCWEITGHYQEHTLTFTIWVDG